MKKLLLSLAVFLTVTEANSQVVVAGVSPTTIVGGYDFASQTHPGWPGQTDNGTWSLALDFNNQGVFIQDTLALADDGTLGLNAQGNPYSASGCFSLPAGSLAGKIAVVYRYDGVDDNPATTTPDGPDNCGFAQKALNCQNAGAVAVLVINREDALNISMTGGLATSPPIVGLDVTIPVVMISLTDGNTLVQEMDNGPVVMFIGNKMGAFQNDISLSSEKALAPKGGMIHSLLAQTGSEFNFEIGANISNPGALAQTDVSVNATITDPTGAVVYNETVSGLTLAAGDTLGIDIIPGEVNNFIPFSLNSYSMGTYTLTYTATAGGIDDFTTDNSISYTFTVNDSVFSYSAIDPTSNSMGAPVLTRPSTNNNTFSVCTVLNDPNASRVAATGIYFAASTNTTEGISLTGEEIGLYLYKWEDPFLDLNDPNLPAGNAWTLTDIGSGFYYYPNDSAAAAAYQGKVIYGAFNEPVILENNIRYLACVQTFNMDLNFGFGNQNYTWNTDYYLQPMFPIGSDVTYYYTGFGEDLPAAVGIALINKDNIGLAEANTVDGVAYPNPANDKVTISIEGEGTASLSVTDISGKMVMTNDVNLIGGKSEVNIAGLESGIYIFNVTLENGKTAQFNVVKK